MKRATKIILKVLYVSVFAFITLCFVLSLFGFRARAVVSGSMEPYIKTGGVVITAPCKLCNLSIGDDITYKTKQGVFVTHRIISIDTEKDKVITKGTANDIEDPAICSSQIKGKVLLSVPYLGYVVKALGMLPIRIALTALLLLGLFLLLFDIRKSGKRQKDY